MRIRVGDLLVSDGHLALIKRLRAGLCYFVIPGGGLHDGEYSKQTAVREAKEEALRFSLDTLLLCLNVLSKRRVICSFTTTRSFVRACLVRAQVKSLVALKIVGIMKLFGCLLKSLAKKGFTRKS